MRERAQGTLTFAGVAAIAVAGWNVQRGATRIGAIVATAAVLAGVTRVLVDASLRPLALRGARAHGPKVAIAGVLVVASIGASAPGALVGTASAETYTKTVDSSRAVVIETSGTDEAQIEIRGTYTGPNGNENTHFLRRTTVTKDLKHYLVDQKAYDSYEVTVTTSSSTTTVDIYGSDYSGGGLGYNSLGHTGGDTNLECGLGAQAGSMFGTYFTDCNPVPSQSINETGVDAQETQTSIYQSGLTQEQAIQNEYTTLDNYLTDAQSAALLVGKNEYIRQLNNGSTKSVAMGEAKAAVNDYYTTRQLNLLATWETSATHYQYMRNKAENDTGTSNESFVEARATCKCEPYTYVSDSTDMQYKGLQAHSVTTLNGTSVTFQTPHWNLGGYESNNLPLDPSVGNITHNGGGGNSWVLYHPVIKPPTSDYDELIYLNPTAAKERWDQIEAQNAATKDELEVYINNTYDEYQSGDIGNEDLIDPYLAAREYSPDPGNFSTWATTSLTLLGTNSPETLENTGNFTVTDETANETLHGILLSDENPPSGSFATGETYDATALGGTQYVVTPDGVEELTGNFTVESITTKDGESVNETAYREINYSTTSTEGYQQVLDELAQTQAELDALQEESRAPTGGGGGVGGGDFLGGIVGALGLPVTGTTKTAVAVGGGVSVLALLSALSG